MRPLAEARGPLNLRAEVDRSNKVRVRGLGDHALDPAEARELAIKLLAAADIADVRDHLAREEQVEYPTPPELFHG